MPDFAPIAMCPRSPLTAHRLPLYLPPMTPKSLAWLQLAGAALLFSTGGAAIKAADFTGWQITCLRSGIAAVAIWLIAAGGRRDWTWRASLVGLAYAGDLTLFVLANRLTTSANTIFLQSTAPLYLLLLAPWLLQEPIRRQDLGLHGWRSASDSALFFLGAERPALTAPDPGRGNLAGGGERPLLGPHGLRSPLDERAPAGARLRGGGGGGGQSHRVRGGFPFALPLGPIAPAAGR